MSSHNGEAPNGQPAPKLRASFWWGMALVLCAVAAVIAYTIFTGIGARLRAATTLRQKVLETAVPTVAAIHPKSAIAAEELVLPGNAQAYVATPIYARVSGYLKTWYFDIGGHVKNGQLLAEIETPELDRQLDQARADLATAQANLELARTTAARYENLFKSDSVAKQDVDDRVGDLKAKQATVDSATYNVRRLEETQRFQKVYAPFDGVVTARNIDIGTLINVSGNAPNKELFDMAATGRLRIYVNVPQQYSHSVRPGGAAEVTLAEIPGRRFLGTIVRNADSIDPASRTLLTEVDVNNPSGELLPGAFCSVHLKLPAPARAVIIPVNTLIFRAQGMQVALVRNHKTELVPVTIGRDYGTEVEVISGITAEDEVIENPSDSLLPGVEVRVAGAPGQ